MSGPSYTGTRPRNRPPAAANPRQMFITHRRGYNRKVERDRRRAQRLSARVDWKAIQLAFALAEDRKAK